MLLDDKCLLVDSWYKWVNNHEEMSRGLIILFSEYHYKTWETR